MVLIAYALTIEDDPGARGTMVTAAIGIIAAEPVARREQHKAPKRDESGGTK